MTTTLEQKYRSSIEGECDFKSFKNGIPSKQVLYNVSPHQNVLKLDHILLQNLLSYLNQLGSQISKGLKFLIGGENVI